MISLYSAYPHEDAPALIISSTNGIVSGKWVRVRDILNDASKVGYREDRSMQWADSIPLAVKHMSKTNIYGDNAFVFESLYSALSYVNEENRQLPDDICRYINESAEKAITLIYGIKNLDDDINRLGVEQRYGQTLNTFKLDFFNMYPKGRTAQADRDSLVSLVLNDESIHLNGYNEARGMSGKERPFEIANWIKDRFESGDWVLENGETLPNRPLRLSDEYAAYADFHNIAVKVYNNGKGMEGFGGWECDTLEFFSGDFERIEPWGLKTLSQLKSNLRAKESDEKNSNENLTKRNR